ncbi:hypothetical protein HZS_5551 [Henneguya salminicola]|nr:hypothetical protein HZS_5551 [Henneguya salminicola]
MEIENESFENYCPMMQNILDIYKIETFTKFSEITKSILSSMNLQVDEFLNRRKMSGNYPSDYLSEKSLKPFIVEPIKEFNHQECPTIEFCKTFH